MPQLPLLAIAVFSVVLTTCAQLLLKSGASSAVLKAGQGAQAQAIAWQMLLTPQVWGGIFVMGLSVLFWLAALTRLDVSRAYPLTALGIVLTMLAGKWLFAESISSGRIIGAVLIFAGIVFIARS